MAVTRYRLAGNTFPATVGTRVLTVGGVYEVAPVVAGPTGCTATVIIADDESIGLPNGGGAGGPTAGGGTWVDWYAYGRGHILMSLWVPEWGQPAVFAVAASGGVGKKYGTHTLPTYASLDTGKTADGVIPAADWARYRVIFPASGNASLQVFYGGNLHGSTPDTTVALDDYSGTSAYVSIGTSQAASGSNTRWSDLQVGVASTDAYPYRSATSGSTAVTSGTTTTTTVTAETIAGTARAVTSSSASVATVTAVSVTPGSAAVASATATGVAVAAESVTVHGRSVSSSTSATTSVEAVSLSPGSATIIVTTTAGATVTASSTAIGSAAITSSTTSTATVTASNPDAGYYPVQTRTHARPVNADDPDDAVKGGPAVLGTHSTELEAISNDLIAARKEGSGFATIRAAVAALWSALAGKASTSHDHAGTYDPAGSAAAAVQRANHTGTQLASTISNFDTQVRTSRLDQMAVPTADVAMGSRNITGLATPTSDDHAASKWYVDFITDGISGGGGSGSPAHYRDVTAYGIVRDCNQVTVNTTAGSTTVTATAAMFGAAFSAASVGKILHIDKAGTGGGWHRTTIATYISPTQVTVAAAPALTKTGTNAITGTDNTAWLNALASALGKNQVMYFPGGDYFYYTDGGHNINAAGAGVKGDSRESSRIVTSHSTNHIFIVNSPYQRFEDFHIQHAAFWTYPGMWMNTTPVDDGLKPTHPTAGAGIYRSPADAATVVYYATYITRVTVNGMWNGFQLDRGLGSFLDDSSGYQCVHAGLQIGNSDNVDNVLARVWQGLWGGSQYEYIGPPGYGILATGCGGLWVEGGHTWGGRFGLALDLVGTFSTNLRINNNSFEDYTAWDSLGQTSGRASRLGTGGGIVLAVGGGFLHSVTVNGNTINTIVATSTSPIQLRPGNGASFRSVSVVGNSSNVNGAANFVNVVPTGSGQVLSGKVGLNSAYGANQANVPSGSTITTVG